jgi:uncharacterized protein with HEPN domain
MPSLSEKDRANLNAILDSSTKILAFTKGKKSANQFYEDEMVYDATLMNFILIGEAVGKLSSTVKSRHSEIPWGQIRGFRNIITHDYVGVNADSAWEVVKQHLPQPKRNLNTLLKLYS